MARTPYYGTCRLCGKHTIKSAMIRHLKKCVTDYPQEKGKEQTVYLLSIERTYIPRYWLMLEMPGVFTLAKLDDYLRGIWLECCGHMSAFIIPPPKGQRGMGWGFSFEMDDRLPGEVDMRRKASQVFESLDKPMKYEYDFGSTTELTIKVIDRQKGIASKLRLVARNDAPEFRCIECDKPAQWFCPYCSYEEDVVFCQEHSEDHGC